MLFEQQNSVRALFAYNPGCHFRKERFWDWSNNPAPCLGTESCFTLGLFLKEGHDFYKSWCRSWTSSLPCFPLIFSEALRLASMEEEGMDWKHGLSLSMKSVVVPAPLDVSSWTAAKRLRASVQLHLQTQSGPQDVFWSFFRVTTHGQIQLHKGTHVIVRPVTFLLDSSRILTLSHPASDSKALRTELCPDSYFKLC